MVELTVEDFEITTMEDLVNLELKSQEEIQGILKQVQHLDDETWKERPEKGTEKPVGSKYYEYVSFQQYPSLNPEDLPESVLVVALSKEGEVGSYFGAFPIGKENLRVGVASGFKDPNDIRKGYNKSFHPWNPSNLNELYDVNGAYLDIVGWSTKEEYRKIGIGSKVWDKFLGIAQEKENIQYVVVIYNHRHNILRDPNDVWGPLGFRPVLNTYDSGWKYHEEKPKVGGIILARKTHGVFTKDDQKRTHYLLGGVI